VAGVAHFIYCQPWAATINGFAGPQLPNQWPDDIYPISSRARRLLHVLALAANVLSVPPFFLLGIRCYLVCGPLTVLCGCFLVSSFWRSQCSRSMGILIEVPRVVSSQTPGYVLQKVPALAASCGPLLGGREGQFSVKAIPGSEGLCGHFFETPGRGPRPGPPKKRSRSPLLRTSRPKTLSSWCDRPPYSLFFPLYVLRVGQPQRLCFFLYGIPSKRQNGGWTSPFFPCFYAVRAPTFSRGPILPGPLVDF